MYFNENNPTALRLNKDLIMHLGTMMHGGEYDKVAKVILGMTPANLNIWIYCRNNGVIETKDASEEKDLCFVDRIIAAKFASLLPISSRQSFFKD